MSVHDTQTPDTSGNPPVLTRELLADADPLMRWRATIGGLHAVGPTIDEALLTLNRAMRS